MNETNDRTTKQKLVQKESAGFYKDGIVFEQIKGEKYVMGGSLYEDYIYQLNDITFFPLTKQPWLLASEATPFDGLDNLRSEISDFLKEHLFLSEPENYEILTSWIIGTWIPEVWDSVPYLIFFGPIGSGKTRALELLTHLSYRAMISSNISPAGLFRAIEELKPTILLDETEILSKDSKSEIFGLLNCGYRKGQTIIRVKNTQNGSHLEYFDVFGFKALAGTYNLKKATESRSIIINTIKAGKIKVRRRIDEKKAEKIRNMLLGFRFFTLADKDVSAVSDVFLDIGDCLDFANGRMLELFTPIVAVAGKDKESIIDYLRKLNDKKNAEELVGEEAEIIQLLVKDGVIDGRNFISTNAITILFNNIRNDDDMITSNRIGWLMRKLGFLSKRIDGQRGWVIQPDRLKKYKEIYNIDEKEQGMGTSNKTAKTTKTATIQSEKSPSLTFFNSESPNNRNHLTSNNIIENKDKFPVCCYCKKPISLDMLTNKDGVPCHKSCKSKHHELTFQLESILNPTTTNIEQVIC